MTRYAALRRAVDGEARRYGRDPAGITLVGISKGQPEAPIAAAIGAGLADIG
ncbi:MAG: YggS family pyridoxal phosphate-dependent enzyme, partial [Candidatus Eremiobacteraeota bacterium]|nr:YggS family pyridoxal phosphate-dependent enzyme [Candidatus Eremiobacteraeota bacterium]